MVASTFWAGAHRGSIQNRRPGMWPAGRSFKKAHQAAVVAAVAEHQGWSIGIVATGCCPSLVPGVLTPSRCVFGASAGRGEFGPPAGGAVAGGQSRPGLRGRQSRAARRGWPWHRPPDCQNWWSPPHDGEFHPEFWPGWNSRRWGGVFHGVFQRGIARGVIPGKTALKDG